MSFNIELKILPTARIFSTSLVLKYSMSLGSLFENVYVEQVCGWQMDKTRFNRWSALSLLQIWPAKIFFPYFQECCVSGAIEGLCFISKIKSAYECMESSFVSKFW